MDKQTQNMCKMFFSFFFVLFECSKHIFQNYFKQLKQNTVEQLDFTSILSFNCF